MTTGTFIEAIRTYIGKARTLRDERRAARFFDSLPPAIRKDIGWPDVVGPQRHNLGRVRRS